MPCLSARGDAPPNLGVVLSMTGSPPPDRAIKIVSYAIGALLALSALAVLVLPQFERVYAKGPPNTGHEMLACADCHTKAPGTLRQQLQAKLQYWLGNRPPP
jgi:hypothetical protein